MPKLIIIITIPCRIQQIITYKDSYFDIFEWYILHGPDQLAKELEQRHQRESHFLPEGLTSSVTQSSDEYRCPRCVERLQRILAEAL